MSELCKMCGVSIEFGNYCRTCLARPVGQPVEIHKPKTSMIYGMLRTLAGLCWVATFLAAILAVLVLFTGLDKAESAPQEAVVCALACAMVIIPYCGARAASEFAELVK